MPEFNVTWCETGTSQYGHCSACKSAGEMPVLLRCNTLIDGRELTFATCERCGCVVHLNPMTVDYTAVVHQEVYLDYYPVQGAGHDVLIAPLYSVDTTGKSSLLDVGCSFGFAADYAQRMLKLRSLGVDPSLSACIGADALQFPLVNAYFDIAAVKHQRFDYILLTEVIEHVNDPAALIGALKTCLADGGLLYLTTPNASRIRDCGLADLYIMLSPGFHLTLFSPSSLTRLLEAAGFKNICVVEDAQSLRAWASDVALEVDAKAMPSPEPYERYLVSRIEELSDSSPVKLGFAYWLLKSRVNRGAYALGEGAFEHWNRIVQARYGLDMRNVDDVWVRLGDTVSTEEHLKRLPLNLGPALVCWGTILLNHRSQYEAASDVFDLAASACARTSAVLAERSILDAETIHLRTIALIRGAHAKAHFDPVCAVEAMTTLVTQPPDDFDGSLLRNEAVALAQRLKDLGHLSSAAGMNELIAATAA